MKSIRAIVSAIAFASALFSSAWAQSTSPNLNLVSADWSPKEAQSLNGLTKTAVWNFVGGPFRGGPGHLCDFRFANLRRAGSLSLVAVIDIGGTAGCTGTQIFDKTESGFEHYSTTADPAGNLRDAIQDINHDGNLELVLNGTLADNESQHFECIPEWPMIFAWTGSDYTDVSKEYTQYYQEYLKSLKTQLAARSSRTAAPQARRSIQNLTPPPRAISIPEMTEQDSSGSSAGKTFGVVVPAPAPSPIGASNPHPDSDCLRVEAAKTEAFLGIRSDTTMSFAIKDSESDDADKRILAAVIFSYIGSKEATANLKTLVNDSDSTVAKLAKERLLGEPDPGIYEFEEERVSEAFLPKQ